MIDNRINREALERIMQRAAELQAGEQEVGEGLTPDEVVALGKEVGIPGKFLQQAMLEQANGRLSVGGAGRMGDCPPASQPCACGWPTARANVSMTWEPSIFLARKSGWSTDIARPETANTICPTCPQMPR